MVRAFGIFLIVDVILKAEKVDETLRVICWSGWRLD
jgi:hypothetical protein